MRQEQVDWLAEAHHIEMKGKSGSRLSPFCFSVARRCAAPAMFGRAICFMKHLAR